MSRKEIYAWCSLGLTLAIFGYYLISVFGLLTGIESYRGHIIGLIWKVIGIAFLIQLLLDLLNSTKFGGVAKDERDILIESKAFRNAYYFLIAAVISVMINVLISDILSTASGQKLFLSVPFMTFHFLVFVIFTASIIKSATQIFYYQRGFDNEKLSNSE
jgi:hypothetical protein